MKVAAPILLVLALGAAGDAVSPITKVLELLGEEQATLLAEAKDSQKVYEEFAEMCEERSAELQNQIKTATAEVAELTASIEEETALAASLSTKIEELTGSIAGDEADLKAATTVRDHEAEDFAAEEKELSETIATLERATGIIEKGGASFAQFQSSVSGVTQALQAMVQASVFSSNDASRLTALVQSSHEQSEDEASLGGPAAAVYEGKSGGIVEVLEDLTEKAETQLDEARKKETASRNNFEMLKQSLTNEIGNAQKDIADSKKGLAAAGEKKSVAEGDLGVTQKDLAADTKALADLHHDCMTKAEDHEAYVKSSGDEMTALAKAKEIIEETTGGASGQQYGLSQESFLQITSSMELAHFEAVRFVRDLARKQNVPALAQLAARMASAVRLGKTMNQDPFAKVKGLITDMITKLEEQAKSEATQKAYCDKELSESSAKKEEQSDTVEKLTTKIDQQTSRSAELKEEVAALQKSLAELASTQSEMDKIRSQEKALYTKNKAEMEKGIKGIQAALQVLKNAGVGANVISLLEICESDFSKSLTEMVATEKESAGIYETETQENKLETLTKEKDVEYKSKEATGLEKSAAEATADRSGVQAELDAVLEYLEKLKGMCTAKAEPYEETKARREAEIAGLQEALKVLEGEAVLLQRGSLRGVRRHTTA